MPKRALAGCAFLLWNLKKDPDMLKFCPSLQEAEKWIWIWYCNIAVTLLYIIKLASSGGLCTLRSDTWIVVKVHDLEMLLEEHMRTFCLPTKLGIFWYRLQNWNGTAVLHEAVVAMMFCAMHMGLCREGADWFTMIIRLQTSSDVTMFTKISSSRSQDWCFTNLLARKRQSNPHKCLEWCKFSSNTCLNPPQRYIKWSPFNHDIDHMYKAVQCHTCFKWAFELRSCTKYWHYA